MHAQTRKWCLGCCFVGAVSEEQCSNCGFDGSLAGSSRILAYAGTLTGRLQQTQLTGTCDRFGAPLDLEFAKDFPIVSFHRVQGEEQPLAHLLIRESLSHEVEDFQLAFAQWLDQGLGRRPRRCVFALLLLSFTYRQHLPDIIRHHPKSGCFGQEVSHRETFVDKETDEAARRG